MNGHLLQRDRPLRSGMAPRVDERSIADVRGEDLRGSIRCHFFAGIGGWEYALRLAGWPEDRPVWTGSCPCQPFSNAGKRLGTADARHLWPAWFRLIRECHPDTSFGEQVESAIGHGWLDGVFADLEGEGYTCGAAVLGAHSVGAPHIRQRLYWVANAEGQQHHRIWNARGGRPEFTERSRLAHSQCEQEHEEQQRPEANERGRSSNGVGGRGLVGGLVQPDGAGSQPGQPATEAAGHWDSALAASGVGVSGMGDAESDEQWWLGESRQGNGWKSAVRGSGAWSDSVWIPCRDGKARRIKSGLEPLAHGVPARVGRLRGYGNAIVPQVAAEFIKAFLEAEAKGGQG